MMCLGKHTLERVAHTIQPQTPPDHSRRHGLDSYYNFFERSAWGPAQLAYQVFLLLITRLTFSGRITLVVDDTLAHKRGKSVWGMGWWRDAVASTKKRVATASGHQWVVLAIAWEVPGTDGMILAFPIMARLHESDQQHQSPARLARTMVQELTRWVPDRTFTLVGDAAYGCKEMLLDGFPESVEFIGRMRGDAALYDPVVPRAKPGQRGRKAMKGPRLPSPREAAKQADRESTPGGDRWRAIDVNIYGKARTLQVLDRVVLWPWVCGQRRIRVVVVRDPEGRMQDAYLFTTNVTGSVEWVVTQFSWRWSVEVLFRGSKQVLDIEAPQHFCQASVEKVAPWVWSMQSVIMVWYVTEGRTLVEATEQRQRMGPWDSEYSLRHMLQVLQRATLQATTKRNSGEVPELQKWIETLENWALLAA
jgi:hypothetical protein